MVEAIDKEKVKRKVRELVRYGILAIFGADRESASKFNKIANELAALGKDDMIIRMIEEVIRERMEC